MPAPRPHHRPRPAPAPATPLALVGARTAAVALQQWVIAELDARGEIDAHAAMCLRNGVLGALGCGATVVVVDLRDLTSIEAGGLALLAQARADCLAGGAQLIVLAPPGYVFC